MYTHETLDRMAVALEGYLKDTGISQNQCAIKIGIPSSYLTHALKRNWDAIPAGTNRKTSFSHQIARKIMNFLGMDTTIWETDNYMITYNLLIECKQYQEHRIIDGSKGTGKTFAANQFKKAFPVDTFLLTCSEDMNPKSLMVELARQVNVDITGDRRKIRIAVCAKLKQMTSPHIIIDESENLKPAAYGSIKAIYDDVKDYCAITLIGANNYIDMLKKKADAGKGCFPQVFSRFSSEPAFLSQLTKDDTVYICSINGITDKDTINKLHIKSSDFRELDRNIKRLLRDQNLTNAA